METKDLNVSFNKSGGTAGSGGMTARVIFPIKWIREMDITPDDRKLKVTFDGKRIILEKKNKG
ncbi:hypothetical protein [Clostridium luticellarii]|uniref:SpoVT-AbrB domain-containing protein n=1 Tax=Clostridium luticellarii TaxID=1691940 RepID=A0A2T0BNQ1_9CLOT|nr:hypothetical protein [Clostridium luticellarii]PRR85504.1 hypothetical protein CLLU_14250 [Clostridium luticellarii]